MVENHMNHKKETAGGGGGRISSEMEKKITVLCLSTQWNNGMKWEYWRKPPKRYIETKGPIKGMKNFKTTNEAAH